MTSTEEADSWIGRTAVDNSGEQIGLITQIWVGDASGQPEWASVKVPSLRGREALVPLAGTSAYGGGRRFAYSRDEIVDAPHGALEGRLEVEDMERLSAYYGAPDTAPGSATWVDRAEVAADGGTVRDISALQGGHEAAPAPRAPMAEASAAGKGTGRFGRKSAAPAPSAPVAEAPAGRKGTGRFGRKSAPVSSEPVAQAPAARKGIRRLGRKSASVA